MKRHSLERLLLDGFLWLQVATILTESLQEGALNAAVNAINGVFLALFLVLAYPFRWPRSKGIKIVSALLSLQLLAPALLSLYLMKTWVLLLDLARLGATLACMSR